MKTTTTHLEDLRNLDLEKIKIDSLQQAIMTLLIDYEKEDDKEAFENAANENIEMLFNLVSKHAPDALPKEESAEEQQAPAEQQGQQDRYDAEEEQRQKKEKSKRALTEVEEISSEIDECRRVIREYNKQRRQAKPPVKKTRLTKLKEKFVGIANLIPDKLKENKNVREQTEKVLLDALADLKKAWQMNVIKQAQEAIRKKFEQLDKHEEEDKK